MTLRFKKNITIGLATIFSVGASIMAVSAATLPNIPIQNSNLQHDSAAASITKTDIWIGPYYGQMTQGMTIELRYHDTGDLYDKDTMMRVVDLDGERVKLVGGVEL